MKLLLAAILVCALLFAAVAGASAQGWLDRRWPWYVAFPVAFAVLAAAAGLTALLFRERSPGPQPAKRLREVAVGLSRGGSLEPDHALDFRLDHVLTRSDVLRADRALRRERTGMRGWVRGLLVLLGFGWLAGFACFAATELPRGRIGLAPVVWLVFGSGLVWIYLVQPWLVRRRLRTATAEEQVGLHFTPEWIEVESPLLGGRVRRSWRELHDLRPLQGGVAITWESGIQWLPDHAFAGPQERARFSTWPPSASPRSGCGWSSPSATTR